MKVYKIVFSPTGGTEKAASAVAEGFGNEIETIDLSENEFQGYEMPTDCIAVIAIPSFGGRAPQTAIERLKKISGNGAKAVAMAVYGNREQEDTLIETADAAKLCGFNVVAGITAVAEHSIAHRYASGRPDNTDAKQLKSFAEQIISKLAESYTEPQLPGNRPYKKAGAGLVPKGNSSCSGCGLCVSKCPTGAISKSDPKKTDKSMCINCMRCTVICPNNARTVSPLMVKLVGAALKKACTERKENKLYI